MEYSDLWWLLLPAIAVMVMFVLWRSRRIDPALALSHAQLAFRLNMAQLQSTFLEAARTSGKPRGLRWKDCQWSDQIEWGRDRQTRQLLALVGVTISFEAVEGGDMEGVEAVGNLRDASAVFAYDGDWRTNGRVIFNLGPVEAVEHFKANYERC